MTKTSGAAARAIGRAADVVSDDVDSVNEAFRAGHE
jgi:hypothetical protein